MKTFHQFYTEMGLPDATQHGDTAVDAAAIQNALKTLSVVKKILSTDRLVDPKTYHAVINAIDALEEHLGDRPLKPAVPPTKYTYTPGAHPYDLKSPNL